MESPEAQQAELKRKVATATGPYTEAVATAGPARRSKYWLSGDADPVLPARVLGVLTIKGELPLKFNFVKHADDDSIEITFEVITTDALPAELLLSRILNLPTIREACLLPQV